MTLKQVERDSPPKRYWKNVVNLFSHFEDHLTNKKSEADEPDPATKIKKYIDDLGLEGNAGERADFVTVCYDTLKGDGDKELQQQVLNTIAWHNEQISLIQTLFKRLEQGGLLKWKNVVINGF